jgi:hypothetical protein
MVSLDTLYTERYTNTVFNLVCFLFKWCYVPKLLKIVT